MTRIYDFTYTGGDSGVHSQVQQYDRLDRAVSQVQYYFDSVRDWRHDVVSYATQARQDRDHIKTLSDTIVITGQQVEEQFDTTVAAADTAVNARDTAKDHATAAQTARTGAETAETNAKTHATDAGTSASSAADILTATEALGITVDTSVGTRVFVGDTMIYGDTGWRDISESLDPPAYVEDGGGGCKIRRINDTVHIRLSGIHIEETNSVTNLLFIPSGFRHDHARHFHYSGRTDTQPSSFDIDSSIWYIRYSGSTEGLMTATNYTISVRFISDQQWPSSLPGTPV